MAGVGRDVLPPLELLVLGLDQRLARRLLATKSGCWIWTGARNDSGYGVANNERVHRLTYLALVGPIPEGMELDHLCRVRECASPRHLEAVTHRVNWRRGMHRNAVIFRGEGCSQGHEYTEANTYYRRDKYGVRQCRRCKADWMARSAARRRAPRQGVLL